jgi:hypothetical protein
MRWSTVIACIFVLTAIIGWAATYQAWEDRCNDLGGHTVGSPYRAYSRVCVSDTGTVLEP